MTFEERTIQWLEDLARGIETYKVVYPTAWTPEVSVPIMNATIDNLTSKYVVLSSESEEANCGRGCCGYTTIYNELKLPTACIDDPEKWVEEEEAKIRKEVEAAVEKEKQEAEKRRIAKLEKEQKAVLKKAEQERALLAELKAKYEA